MSRSLVEEKQHSSSKKNYILQTLTEMVNFCMGSFASDGLNQAVVDLIVLSLESPVQEKMRSKVAKATLFLEPNNKNENVTAFLDLIKEVANNPDLDRIIGKIIGIEPFYDADNLILARLEQVYNPKSKVFQKPIKPTHPLFSAVAANDPTEVARILTQGQYTINDKDHNGYTPFLFAAKNGCTDVVKKLLPSNTVITHYDAVRIYSFWNSTVANYQSAAGHEYEPEPFPAGKISEFEMAFVLAAESGHIPVVNHLLSLRRLSSDSCEYHMAERLSAGWGHRETVKLLVDNWAPNTQNRQKRLNKLLWIAILYRHLAIVKQLFNEYGAKLEDKSSKLPSLTYVKSRNIRPRAIACFLYAGVRFVDMEGYVSLSEFTELFYDADKAREKLEKFETLMQAIQPDRRESFSQNLLMAAAGRGSLDIVGWLLWTGKARVNQKDESGQTVLSQLTDPKIPSKNRIQMAEFLIGYYGADPVNAAQFARALLTANSTALGNSNLEDKIKQQAKRFQELYDRYYSIQIKILHERGFTLENKGNSPKERINEENKKLVAKLKAYVKSINDLSWITRPFTKKEDVLSNTLYNQILFLNPRNPSTICEIADEFLTNQSTAIKDREFTQILKDIIAQNKGEKSKTENKSTTKETLETPAKPPLFKEVFAKMLLQDSGQQAKSATESSSNLSSFSSSTPVVLAEKETSPAESKTGPGQTYAQLRERIGEKEATPMDTVHQPTMENTESISKIPKVQKNKLEQIKTRSNEDDHSSQFSSMLNNSF